jgi:hypothetical protein
MRQIISEMISALDLIDVKRLTLPQIAAASSEQLRRGSQRKAQEFQAL